MHFRYCGCSSIQRPCHLPGTLDLLYCFYDLVLWLLLLELDPSLALYGLFLHFCLPLFSVTKPSWTNTITSPGSTSTTLMVPLSLRCILPTYHHKCFQFRPSIQRVLPPELSARPPPEPNYDDETSRTERSSSWQQDWLKRMIPHLLTRQREYGQSSTPTGSGGSAW